MDAIFLYFVSRKIDRSPMIIFMSKNLPSDDKCPRMLSPKESDLRS